MNKGFLVGIVAFMLWPLCVSAGEKSPWEVKLPFKSATIHYTISGMENGSEVTYVRDHGREVSTYHTTKTTMMGMTMVNETVQITTPEWDYDFDLTNRTGSKNVNPEKYMIEEYKKLSKAEQKQVLKNTENMGGAVAEGYGGNVQPNAEKILGYSCDRAEMMGTVAYSIHGTGIPLLVTTNMMGMSMKVEATSVDEGRVDDKFFQLPEGIEPFMDPQSDAMAREMARQTITMLKDPEGAKKLGEEARGEQMQGDEQLTPAEQDQMEQAMEMLKGVFGNPN